MICKNLLFYAFFFKPEKPPIKQTPLTANNTIIQAIGELSQVFGAVAVSLCAD